MAKPAAAAKPAASNKAATSNKTTPADGKPEKTPSMPATQKTAVGPAFAFAAEDKGAGFENAGASAYAIPFLTILQSGSPQCKRQDPAYIKDATEGMLFNTVSGEVFDGDEGLEVIACGYNNSFIEWGLREEKKGFVAEYDQTTGTVLLARATRDEKSRNILPSGNQLVDTRNHYLLYKHDDGLEPALMSLSSTATKASRVWMSNMSRECKKAGAPMFGLRFQLKTVARSNAKGQWYGPDFEFLGLIENEETYLAAKAMHQQVKSGGIKPPTRSEAPSDGATDQPDEM